MIDAIPETSTGSFVGSLDWKTAMPNPVNNAKVDESIQIAYCNNRKKSGSQARKRYEVYQKSKTIGEYIEICRQHGFSKKHICEDLGRNLDHGYLELKKPSIEEQPKQQELPQSTPDQFQVRKSIKAFICKLMKCTGLR